MTQIEQASNILNNKHATCVSINKGKTFISYKRGIEVILCETDKDADFFRGASVADKVIGKAAAILFSHYGVKELHACVTSNSAIEYLINKKINFTYDKVIDYISNRDGSDMCPFEKSVLNTDDFYEAEKNIRKTFESIRKMKEE